MALAEKYRRNIQYGKDFRSYLLTIRESVSIVHEISPNDMKVNCVFNYCLCLSDLITDKSVSNDNKHLARKAFLNDTKAIDTQTHFDLFSTSLLIDVI